MQKGDFAGASVEMVDIYQIKGDTLYGERYKEINTNGCKRHCTGTKESYKTGELAALIYGPEATVFHPT